MSSVDWLTQRKNIIQAIRNGFHKDGVREHIEAGPVIGPNTFDKLGYPYAEVLPESTNRVSSNEFEHLVRMNTYFERSREGYDGHAGEDYLDNLAIAMEALDGAMDELSALESTVTWIPQAIEDFAGELNGSLLVVISVQIRCTTLVDLADS